MSGTFHRSASGSGDGTLLVHILIGVATSNVYSFQQLLKNGLTRTQIADGVSSGQFRRLIRGWYAGPGADGDVARAVAAGARLGCLTGCKHHGLWVPHHSQIHAVAGRSAAAATTRGMVLHTSASPQPHLPVWPLLDCLEQVSRRHDKESALIVAESAVNLGMVTRADLVDIAATLPNRRQTWFEQLAEAESGSETRVRLFLQRQRIGVRAQVVVPEVGRVDLLVGRSLILECDSEAHHGAPQNQREDRRRDLAARDAGYDTIRLSYQQVWHQWDSTQTSLMRHIRTRGHLKLPGVK